MWRFRFCPSDTQMNTAFTSCLVMVRSIDDLRLCCKASVFITLSEAARCAAGVGDSVKFRPLCLEFLCVHSGDRCSGRTAAPSLRGGFSEVAKPSSRDSLTGRFPAARCTRCILYNLVLTNGRLSYVAATTRPLSANCLFKEFCPGYLLPIHF